VVVAAPVDVRQCCRRSLAYIHLLALQQQKAVAMPFSMRVVHTAAHFGACLADEVAPHRSERNYSWLLLRVYRSRTGATVRGFFSRCRESQAKPGRPGIPLTASPKGEGVASPFSNAITNPRNTS
jgi:hypothetical protein